MVKCREWHARSTGSTHVWYLFFLFFCRLRTVLFFLAFVISPYIQLKKNTKLYWNKIISLPPYCVTRLAFRIHGLAHRGL